MKYYGMMVQLQELDQQLAEQNLAPQEMGKEEMFGIGMGYILALGETEAIALHDCDILTYNKNLLARLIYPVANPRFNFDFFKGYYPRVSNGKVRKSSKIIGNTTFKSFRKNNRI